MTSQELLQLKNLFEKKDKLKSAIDNLNFPCDSVFILKSIKVEAEFYNRYGKQTIVFYDLHIDSNELRHFYTRRKNFLMAKLHELNNQIEKIEITNKP